MTKRLPTLEIHIPTSRLFSLVFLLLARRHAGTEGGAPRPCYFRAVGKRRSMDDEFQSEEDNR